MTSNVVTLSFAGSPHDSTSNNPVHYQPTHNGGINISSLQNSRRVAPIQTSVPVIEDNLSYEEHDAEPIRSLDDINRISQYFISNGQYRNNMLFIMGINFGLRCSDIRRLRFSHIINPDNTFKTTFPILEKKTSNTRKVKLNRHIAINNAVMDAVCLYLQHNPEVTLNHYIFRSESRNSQGSNSPISRQGVEAVIKGVTAELGITGRYSTHTLRKTFGFHFAASHGHDPRSIQLLQKMFNHSSERQTLTYIGVTKDEIVAAYQNLNLGAMANVFDAEIIESISDQDTALPITDII